MQFSIGVEYALHCLLYLIDIPSGKHIGIKDLAEYQGVSVTYLSKVFTKLRKAGIVRSISGVKGGYELLKAPTDISFFDVVQAIEGTTPLFQCVEIRQKEVTLDKENIPDAYCKEPCIIKSVMFEAEDKMNDYLKTKSLQWLNDEATLKLPKEELSKTKKWFRDRV